MKNSLILNGKHFSLSETVVLNLETGKTPFEKSTLEFCKLWLNGEIEFILQTSGSTGTPKEIRISRLQMEASAKLTIEALELKEGMTSFICLDTQFIAGKMMLARSFLNNMNVIATEPTANPIANVEEKIDFAAFVPYQVERILSESKSQLDNIGCALVGGAPISAILHEKMQTTSCQLYATYGMTETISHIALQKLNGEAASDFFTTQPGVHLKVDEQGCLTIQANYLGPEPIITNDLVELLSPTTFKWLGRLDNVINTGGIKVSPEKVERVFEDLCQRKNITHRFFVGGVADKKLGEQVVLVIESEPFSDSLQRALLTESSAHLSKYEIPKRILFVQKFKETATGKVNRKETIRNL